MTPLAQEKLFLSHTLRSDRTILQEIGKALSDAARLNILAALLENEAKSEEPLAYTKLMERVELKTNALAYHLRLLRHAGLVKQVTPIPLEDATPETGYRSFYRTTSLAMMVMRCAAPSVGNAA